MTAPEEEAASREYEFWDREFPDAAFTICLDPDDLYKIISFEPRIFVKTTFVCFCYEGCNRPAEFIEIISNNGVITTHDILTKLIESNFSTGCNHNFLESIYKMNNIQYELFFGS